MVTTAVGDCLRRVYHPGVHPDPLSLAIPPWVGAMSAGDGFGHRWGRNGEFCVAVGLLACKLKSVKGVGC